MRSALPSGAPEAICYGMGSSGASRFSDYPEKPRSKVKGTGGQSGVAGGSSGQDPCDLAFSAVLEDFERSDYFKAHRAAPKVGTQVIIDRGKRLFARTRSGESVGNLPTRLNYLAMCIESGRSYSGRIRNVSPGLIAKITIDAGPQ